MEYEEAVKLTLSEFLNNAKAQRQPVEIEHTETEEVIETTQPNDVYQNRRNEMYDTKTRNARGAMPRMKLDLSALQDSNIKYAHKKALDDSEYYTSICNKQYANMVKQKYMEDEFLPVVDALVRMNGLGAVQSNQQVLSELDGLTLLNGNQGHGYTQAYLASMYGLEDAVERTDAMVEKAIREIKYLCANDQIRSAVGKANDIKKRIDAGENVASGEDYEVLQRVALYG